MAARAGLPDRWSRKLDPEQDLVWRAALWLYADLGHAPRTIDLAAKTGLAPADVSVLLDELEARDLLALDGESGQLRLAYPFTQAKTEHQVELNGRTLYALCAIDALGVGAMYRADTAIQSRCRHCGQAIRLTTLGAGRTVGSVEPSGSVVWYDYAYDGSAAASCCPSIAFFCSDAHLEQWRPAQIGHRTGTRLAMDEALEVGRAIFGPVLVESSDAER
ncbi:MAG: hypothetical protein HYX38_05260 [Rhodospirillales bacterium]|nr:hypothetical protein [Rhodospirillales bacterium]